MTDKDKNRPSSEVPMIFPGHVMTVQEPCPHCGSTDGSCYELQNYDPIWRDGDIYCKNTNKRIRGYDAG